MMCQMKLLLTLSLFTTSLTFVLGIPKGLVRSGLLIVFQKGEKRVRKYDLSPLKKGKKEKDLTIFIHIADSLHSEQSEWFWYKRNKKIRLWVWCVTATLQTTQAFFWGIVSGNDVRSCSFFPHAPLLEGSVNNSCSFALILPFDALTLSSGISCSARVPIMQQLLHNSFGRLHILPCPCPRLPCLIHNAVLTKAKKSKSKLIF